MEPSVHHHHQDHGHVSMRSPSTEPQYEFDFANNIVIPNKFLSARGGGDPGLGESDYVNEAYSWEHFDFPHWRRWMSGNFHLPIIIAILYLTMIAFGGRWMTSRKAYGLKGVLVVWNAGFALFSLAAFLRTFPDLWRVVWYEESWSVGFYKSVCSSEGLTLQFAFWSWTGTLSKIAELGDTAFVILRKQRLIFLHWFHHSTTMLYTWFIFPSQEPCHRWLMTMNFFIHTLMYSYYAVKANGVKLPRFISVSITSLQILQMVVGVYVNLYTWRELGGFGLPGSERGCERYHFNLLVAAGMYTSYLALFANFFYQTYFKKGKRKTE